MSASMRADSSGPMPAIGSSSSTRRGRLASARPTSSARCSPCESASMRERRAWRRGRRRRALRARCSNSAGSRRTGRQAPRLDPLAACTASATLSSTLEAPEQPRDLERAHQPAPRALVRRQPRDVGAVEDDAAAVARELAGELRHQRRLAGAVRPDQRMHLAAPHLAGRRRRSRRTPPKRLRGRARRAAPSRAHRALREAPPASPPGHGARTAPPRAAPSRSRTPSARCRPTAPPAAAAAPPRRAAPPQSVADAAEDHHHHQRARLRPVQQVRADVALLVRPSSAPAMPPSAPATTKHDQLAAVGRKAERFGALSSSRIASTARPKRDAHEARAGRAASPPARASAT